MLTSITPLGERGRGNSWAVTMTAYAVGCLLGDATTGAVLGAVGTLLPDLPALLSARVKMAVYVADEPLGCVVRGTGRVLNELDTLRKVLLDLDSPRRVRVR